MIKFTPIILILFVACSQQHGKATAEKESIELSQQKEFVKFLSSFGSMSTTNELRTKELIDSFDIELKHRLDSVPVFYNWEGSIKWVNLRQMSDYSIVDFTILYTPKEYQEIEFHCTHIVKTSEVNKDSIYQTLKKAEMKQTVFIDGFIERDMNDKVLYEEFLLGEFEKAQYPRYKFRVIDLRTSLRPNYPSQALESISLYNAEIFSLLKQYTLKKLSQKDWKKKTKELTDSIEIIQPKLSPYELEIDKRTRQKMADSFQTD